MTASRQHLLVAWAGADFVSVKTLLDRDRPPGLAGRLVAGDRFSALSAPAVSPLALAITLASGASPGSHGLLAPAQPMPDGTGWELVTAARWPFAPVWDVAAALDRPTAAIGWPGSHGAPFNPQRLLVSDLDLAAVDAGLRLLPPLDSDHPADVVMRVAPDELSSALLGFFIPAAELPAEPARDPVLRRLLRHLALTYSIHNTAVAALLGGSPPLFLAVHYPTPFFSAAELARYPQLRESFHRLLDLLLTDLLSYAAPDAVLDLVGLAPTSAFIVSARPQPPEDLAEVARALLTDFALEPAASAASPAIPPARAEAWLRRRLALSDPPRSAPKGPPRMDDWAKHHAALGEILLAENRPADALAPLATAFFARPEDHASARSLFDCLQHLGLRAEADEPAAALRDHAPVARPTALPVNRAAPDAPLSGWAHLLEQAARRDELRDVFFQVRAATLARRSAPAHGLVGAARPEWTVRLARTDELSRLPTSLRQALAHPRLERRWSQVLVAGELERIVGATLVSERGPASARLDFAFAASVETSSDSVSALLGAALDQADALCLEALETQAALPSVAADWLAARGFVTKRTHEIWRASFAPFIESRGSALRRVLARRPVELHPLSNESLSGVRALCAKLGLLSAERIQLAPEKPDGFDGRLCFVAGSPTSPVAVLLARYVGGQIYLEVLARDPEAPAGGAEIGALVLAFSTAAQALGATDMICAVDAGQAAAAQRLLARTTGRRIELFAILHRSTAKGKS